MGPHDMSDGAKIQEVIGPDFQLRVWSLRHGLGKVYQGPPGFKWVVNVIIDEKRGHADLIQSMTRYVSIVVVTVIVYMPLLAGACGLNASSYL